MSPRARRKNARGSAGGPAAPAPKPRRWWPWIAAAMVAGAAVAFTWLRGRPPAPAGPAAPRDNLLLITLDTTRADRLGCYGYAAARTRHLDRLAAEGVRFENAVSPAPITLPAHASIFTGLYPFAHGVRNNGNFYLGDGVPTLGTRLKAEGYRTAAFVSSFILDRRYGLARGFDLYDDRMTGAQAQVVSLEAERRGDRTSRALEDWLQAQAASPAAPAAPFFVWLHLYDPHEPYRPPPPFRDLFPGSPYDGEIAFTDAIVAAVLDRLGALGQLDRTLVAVIGDHGESLGEHGEETHTMFVYEGAVRVPLLLWRPGRLPAGKIVSEPVRATDLAPTLLELLAAPPLKTAHGRSLLPLIEGKADEATPAAYAESLLPQLQMNWAPLFSLRDERWKLIDAPEPELYDLHTDPRESRNLYRDQPQKAGALQAALKALLGSGTGAMSVTRMDRDTAEKLAALGYVGAGADPGAPEAGARSSDPKAMIAVFNRLRQANTAVRERRFAEALPLLREVLRDDPRNAFARLVMGSANMAMGRLDEAIVWFKRYLELVPTSAYAHHWIAVCHLQRGAHDLALKEAEVVLAMDPRFSDARVLRGGILASRGAYDEAIRELRAAVESDPAKPLLRLDLAKVLAEAGRTEEADAEYQTLLKLQPDFAPALTGLAALRVAQGRHQEAIGHLRRALEVHPGSAEARFDLGRALEMKGDRDAARAEYERLLEEPRLPAAVRDATRRRLAQLGR